jgi:hypothetical protein
LNTGKMAVVLSMSCAALGSCAAGGSYTDRNSDIRAFVVSEVKGRWGTTAEVAGTAAGAWVLSVSCAAAGDCSAGGNSGNEAFVVREVKGHWAKAAVVPVSVGLSNGGIADVGSVSCAAPGNCAAGGSYTDRRGNYQAFVVSQVNGT